MKKEQLKIRGGGGMLFLLLMVVLSPLFANNPVLKCVSIDDYPPFDYVNKRDKLSGINQYYFQTILKKLNINSKCIRVKTLSELLDIMKNNEADITITSYKFGKFHNVIYSKPFLKLPIVIATRDNISFITDIELLKGKKIAVSNNYISKKFLLKKYPYLDIVEVENVDKALDLLECEKVDAVVDLLPTLIYEISQHNYFDVHIAGETGEKVNFRIMLNKKYSYLIPQINKVINSITPLEKTYFYQQNLRNIPQPLLKWKDIKVVIVLFVVIILMLIIFSTIIIYYLKKQNKLNKDLVKMTKKAEESAKAKSEFLANMSHEIRTPLNAMFGFVSILQQKELDKESKQYLNIIEKSGKNLLIIINDILDFSKLESGKFQIEIIEFNPKEEFSTIEELFKSRASEKDILLHIDEGEFKYKIYSDPTRIKQVIANLLSNAIKFTPEHKNVYLTISYNEKKEKLYVEVRDEGIGIPKEKLSTIFEVFSQADSSTTRKYGGTGLGLSISHRLIELLGGELKVKSHLSKGSKFYFEIPAKKGEKIKEESKITKQKIIHKIYNYHILLVEDNKANQMFMKVVLQKLGITLDIANDGIEAIELFSKNRYDYILMDENMPNMDGITATKKIREYEKEYNLCPTKIIALTANALIGDRERFMMAGMDYYLSKPLDINELEKIFQSRSV